MTLDFGDCWVRGDGGVGGCGMTAGCVCAGFDGSARQVASARGSGVWFCVRSGCSLCRVCRLDGRCVAVLCVRVCVCWLSSFIGAVLAARVALDLFV